MAITQLHLEIGIPLHNPTSRVNDHSAGLKSSVNGHSPSLTFKAYSHSFEPTLMSMIPYLNSCGESFTQLHTYVTHLALHLVPRVPGLKLSPSPKLPPPLDLPNHEQE